MHSRLIGGTLLLLACLAASAQTQAPTAAPTQAAAPVVATPVVTGTGAVLPDGAKALTAQDLDAWLDGYMPYALATGNLAGAVVAVVKDGQIVTERGFGYSDVARRAPVDPRLTLFRPGSVSKLVTWTAVMQQVEAGKIDLDADVNTYLDFKIPARDGKPVTMRELMQHTAGFEEQAKSVLSNDPDAPGFVQLLKTWTPARVFAPGTTPAYSNYGASLAGYIVQRVSGESFDDYVERHIFAPLEMTHSTFRQPLPAALVPLMSKGYALASDDAEKFEMIGPAPAGSLSSTGEDMAHFMIAHLQDGEYNGQRILQPQTARQMHDSPLTLLPPLNRMELGFFETNINGHEVIGHLGDTNSFHTSLHLFMKEGVGLYVSFNSAGKEGAAHTLRHALFEDFADRYFPAAPERNRVDAATAAEHARMMVGSWVNSRGAQSNFLSVLDLVGQTKVSLGKKGELVVPALKADNGVPIRWVETAPFLWQDAYGHERLAAKVENGHVVRFSIDMISPFMVFDREPASRDAAWLLPLVGASCVALLLTVLCWPFAVLVRRRYKAPLALSRQELRAYRGSKIAALLIVAAIAAWATTIGMMFADFNHLTARFDPVVHATQLFGILAFVGGFLLMLWNALAVWSGRRRWPAKVWSVVLVVASGALLYTAFVYHLLGLGVGY